MVPYDNLAAGIVFPVYPEVTSSLGVHGKYIFVPLGKYRLIGLECYLSESFQYFRSAVDIQPTQSFAPLIARAEAVMQAYG